MRRIRFWTIAIISFFSIATGTIWHRFLAVSLCTVLGFHSTACFVGDSGRANAAVPPVVWDGSSTIAQNIDIFRNDGGNSPPPQTDILIPSNNINSQVNSESLSGLWIYSIYNSPSSKEPFFIAPVELIENGDEIITSLCQKDCDSLRLSSDYFVDRIPQEQSLVAEYENLTLETVESTDAQAIWGKITERNSRETVYFAMEKATKNTSKSSFKRVLSKHIYIPRLSKTSITITQFINPINPFIPSVTQQIISRQLKEIAESVNKYKQFWQSEINGPLAEKRALGEGTKKVQETLMREVTCGLRPIGVGLANKDLNIVTRGCLFKKLPSTGRNLLRGSTNLRNLGKLSLRGARVGLRIAGRLAIPLLLLDLGLTAYEFCANNPGTCERIGNDVVRGVNDLRNKIKFAYSEMTGKPPNSGMQSFTWTPDYRLITNNFNLELLAKSLESEFETYAKKLKEQSSKNSQKNYIAQFGIPGLPNIPGIPGGGTGIIKDAVLTQVVGQLGGFIENERPFSTSFKDVYPTVSTPPGGEFRPSPANLQVFSQALRQANGSPEILLPPGDYEIPGQVFCFKPRSYGPQTGVGYPLAPIKGKQAAPLVALNSRYITAGIPHEDAQVLSWNIQLGVKYEDMAPTSRLIVDRILPEFKQQLSRSFWEDLQAKWGQISGTIPGVPSFDSVIGKLPGEVGEVLNTYQQARASLQQYRDNFDQLQNEMVFGGNAPGSSLDSKYPRGIWSKINDRLYARLLPTTFDGPATMQVRVLDANGNVGQPSLLNSAPQPFTPSQINNSAPQLMNPPQNPTQPAPANLW